MYISEFSSVQRPDSRSHGPRCRRAEARRLGHGAPEGLERRLRAVDAAVFHAAGHHRRVHRAGRRAGDAVDLQPRLLDQPVEHAPGERPVRAAALQGQVDQQRFGGGGGHRRDDKLCSAA
jgi:hypothetical protein